MSPIRIQPRVPAVVGQAVSVGQAVRRRSPERHAVYAVTTAGVTFRVGLPVDWHTAQARWLRLDDRRRAGRVRVRHMRRWYTVQALEVRSADKHGRSLAHTERHATALPVPYRAQTNR